MEPHSRKIEELVDYFVPDGCQALDVGCGTGINTSRLKSKTSNLFGFDIADYRREPYKQDFQYVLGSPDKLSFGNSQFDLITTWDVIEHVENDLNFLHEIYRVLKPGGLVLLSTPNCKRLSNRILNLIGKKITYPYYLGHEDDGTGDICHLREYLLKELVDLSKRSGFKIKQAEGVYLGFHGFLKMGIFKSPKFLYNFTQHLFVVLEK